MNLEVQNLVDQIERYISEGWPPEEAFYSVMDNYERRTGKNVGFAMEARVLDILYKKGYEIEEKTVKTILSIKEDFKIPGTDIILESGDKIRVLESNREVETLIKSLRKIIPWDDKPEKSVQSAMHELSGKVNGKMVDFGWHQPGRYGKVWDFIGLLVGYDKMFEMDMDNYDGYVQEPTSLERLKKAIDYVQSMKSSRFV